MVYDVLLDIYLEQKARFASYFEGMVGRGSAQKSKIHRKTAILGQFHPPFWPLGVNGGEIRKNEKTVLNRC